MSEFLSNVGTWITTWFSSGWLLAIILMLFLIDLTLFPLVVGPLASILLTVWICLRFGPWGMWTVIWGILIFLGVYGVYFLTYVSVNKWLAQLLQRGAPEEKLHRIIGKTGHIRIVSEKTMLKWDDELWPIQEEHADFRDGETVKCVAFKDGIAIVQKIEQDADSSKAESNKQ